MCYLGVADAGADLGLELVFSSSCNKKNNVKTQIQTIQKFFYTIIGPSMQ